MTAGRVHEHPHGTEVAAAESMRPTIVTVRARVMDLLRAHPEGLTDDEGAQLLNDGLVEPYADRLTFGRRRQELCKLGRVCDTGRRRDTPHGRRAIVWRAV